MNEKEKIKTLKSKLSIIRDEMEMINVLSGNVIEHFENLDDFVDLINNMHLYQNYFNKDK